MTNIVVDTNVFVHSCNPNNAYFERAVEFIEDFVATRFTICVDEGLDENEAQNSSQIWSEYRAHIPQASLALEVLTQLLIDARVVEFPKKTTQDIHKKIRDNVNDTSDIVFVKVAYNSASVALVSHDFEAFPDDIRLKLNNDGISNIVDCLGVLPL